MTNPTQPPLGRLAYMAFTCTSDGVYGTEQDVQASSYGHLAPVETGALHNTKPESIYPHGANLKFEVVELLTDVKGGFEFKVPLRYDGIGMAILTWWFGGADTVSTVDTTAKKHKVAFADYNTNIGSAALWFASTNGLVQALKSFKIASVSLECKSNAPVMVTVKALGDSVILNSTANTAAKLVNMSLSADAKKKAVMYWHARTRGAFNAGYIRIARKTGSEGNLSSSQDIFATMLKLTLDRHYKQPDSQDKEMGEPYEDGPPTFQGEIDVAGFEGLPSDRQGTARGLIDRLQNQLDSGADEYKLGVLFDSPDLAGSVSQHYGMQWLMPSIGLHIPNPSIAGMGQSPAKIGFRAMQAAAAANGSDWSGITDPLDLTIWNQRASAYIGAGP